MFIILHSGMEMFILAATGKTCFTAVFTEWHRKATGFSLGS